MTTVCIGDVLLALTRGEEWGWSLSDCDLKLQPDGYVPLESKQAYYKKLKLEPLGVKCPQSWNSKATAVSVVGSFAALTKSKPAARWISLALTLAVITSVLFGFQACYRS